MRASRAEHDAMRCEAMRWYAMRCDAMRCDGMRCDAMRCEAMRCDAMRGDAMRCDAMRCDAMRCDAMRWYVTREQRTSGSSETKTFASDLIRPSLNHSRTQRSSSQLLDDSHRHVDRAPIENTVGHERISASLPLLRKNSREWAASLQ